MIFEFSLGLIMAVLYVNSWIYDFKDWRIENPESSFLSSTIVLATVYMAFMIAGSVILVNFLNPLEGVWIHSQTFLIIASFLLSFLISFYWFRYLWWIDIFEREKSRTIIILFLVSCLFTLGVTPCYNFLRDYLNFSINGELLNDAFYCVFGIGVLEELAKIIPFLIILKFTDEVNEPFDYILYGAVSALGFAFIENAGYLYITELESLNGRSLFASVMHMIATSIITYGLAIKKFKKTKAKWVSFIPLLFLAACAHGFYDFWLINPIASKFYVVTFVFLIILIKIWMIMKNNLLNISPYFCYSKKLMSFRFKYRLLNALLSVSLLAYISLYLIENRALANDFLLHSMISYMFILLFISINFSRFEVIKNYMSPFNIGKNPLQLLLPVKTKNKNLVGRRLEMRYVLPRDVKLINKKLQGLKPFTGTLVRRIVIKEDSQWYLFKSDQIQNLGHGEQTMFLLRPRLSNYLLNHPSWHPINFKMIFEEIDLEKAEIEPESTLDLNDLFVRGI